MNDVIIRKPYEVKPRCGISFEDCEMLTEQCHKEMCDINNIIAQYDKTGLIQHVAASMGRYGDYTEVNEYQESLNTVIQAKADFMALPSHIRKRFGNDPGEFFEFVTNPDNADEIYDLGLAIKPAPDEPILVKTVESTVDNEPSPEA